MTDAAPTPDDADPTIGFHNHEMTGVSLKYREGAGARRGTKGRAAPQNDRSHPPPDGLPVPRRHWAFLTIAMTIGLAVMDSTVANVALPVIAAEFHTSPSLSIWIVNAYQLALVMALLPLANVGEIHGYRRVYVAGIVVFTAASLACALSDSLLSLTLSRVAQGLGAAGIMSVNTALIRYIYPRNHFGRAIGVNAMVAAVASTIGPSFASAVLGIASWSWLFAVNVPIGLAALVIGRRSLPDSDRADRSFDWLSAVLTASSIGFVITSLDSLGHALAWPLTALQIVLAIASTVWVVRRQAGAESPLLPLDLLRGPVFALSVGTSICSFAAQMLAYVALPFFLHIQLAFSVSVVGFLIVPWPLAVAISAPVAGMLSDRYSAGMLGSLGLVIMAVGLALVALLPEHPAVADIVWRISLCGVGFGFFQAPNNRTIVGSAPKARTGAASGMLGTARLFGQAIGAALVALLLARFPGSGVVLALFAGALFAAVGAVVSMLRVAVPPRVPLRGQ